MDRRKVKVWECKIIVDEDVELPQGFDNPPRKAAIAAVEAAGVKVLGCSSGWGGSVTEEEEDSFNSLAGDIYFAGLIDDHEGSMQ